jgi:4-amino-4-deoxy-L-arabinose transferase-like glycosyltransferase
MTDLKILALIVAGFVATLFSVQYTGEESVYTVSAYEMWYHGQWLSPTLYGEPYRRPPLINWLIIGITFIISWEYAIAAVRIVSALATFGSAAVIFWFLKRMKMTVEVASIGALIYLTMWQVIGGYGWKGYSDALFGSFTLTAMLFGYLAIKESSLRWLLFAIFFSYLGFLTKALTSFVFLFSALFITALVEKRLTYLVKIGFPVFFIQAAVLVGSWYAIVPSGNQLAEGMLFDIFNRYLKTEFNVFFRHISFFPFETMLNMLPASAFLLFLGLKGGIFQNKNSLATIFGLTGLIGFLPYWIAPVSHSRYLMPIYGIVAIYLTLLIQGNFHFLTLVRKVLVWVALFKLAYAVFLFPLYTSLIRPPIHQWAANVKEIVGDELLFSVDQTWIGISVVDTVNRMIYPRPPIVRSYVGVDSGFVMSNTNRHDLGILVKSFDSKMFLYCFGVNCVE